MEENLWIYALALDSGFIPFTEFIAWTDRQVLVLEAPSRWLLDLCTSKTKEEALGILWTQWNRNMETVGRGWSDAAIHDDFYFGLLYLQFERGDLTMAELLELAGRYSDAKESNIPCETFYCLLNEIDGGGPTNPSDGPLEDRVTKLFTPMAKLARRISEI